jgi:hypothetical protein
VGEAPAPLGGQVFQLERKEVHVVGAGGQAREQLRALAHVQAPLHAGMPGAELGKQARGDRAGLRLGGELQRLGPRLAKRAQPGIGAQQAMDELVAGVAQRVARAGEVQLAAALLEERHLHGLGELLDLQRYGGLGEVQLFGRARHAAQAGYGFEDQELRQQPMTKETARSGARHLGSLAVTEVWLAA